MHDLAKEHPEKLAEMKKLFLAAGEGKQSLPHRRPASGCAFIPKTGSRRPTRAGPSTTRTTRMPEFTAPALGNTSNTVTIDLEVRRGCQRRALRPRRLRRRPHLLHGQGPPRFRIQPDDHRSLHREVAEKIAPGKHTIVVDTTLKAPKPGAPADIVLSVDGKEVARTTAKMTVPAAFTASETFDVGVDLGSPVSRDYFERRPFKFDGKIEKVRVELK